MCLRSRLLSEAVAALLTSHQGLDAVAAAPGDVVPMAAAEATVGVLVDTESAKTLKGVSPLGCPMIVLGRREQDVRGLHDVVTGLAIDVDIAELGDALRALARGDLQPAPRKTSSTHRGRRSTDGHDWLTPRELQVLELLAAASTASEIAKALDVSENTVRTHVQNLLAKLDASTQVDAVARARSLGLLETTRSR